MDGKEGKWKKEMEKRTLSTLLNKENEEENASSKKLKTNSPQISNSAKTTFSQPFTTVALNTPTDSGSKTTNCLTPSISSLSSSSSSSVSKVKSTDQLALPSSPMSIASTSKPQSQQSVKTSYDYTNESDSLVKVLKLVGRISNPNEFAVCGEAGEMPGHAGIFVKDYGLITPPLPIYQAEEMVKKMRPQTVDVNSKSVGSQFEMKEIYKLDACDIEFKNPKVFIYF
jgi:hypothetical protein